MSSIALEKKKGNDGYAANVYTAYMTTNIKDTFGEFRSFLLRGNVVDLAIGVVIGAAFNTVVNALVKGLITPFIAAVGGQPDFATLSFSINGSQFLYGEFINALLSFIIMSAVVFFFVVKPINKLVHFAHKADKESEPLTRFCPECLAEVPAKAKRCMYCTSVIKDEK